MGKLRDQLVSAQVAKKSFEIRQAESVDFESRSDRERSLTFLLTGIAAFYFAVHFGATKQVDAIGMYASYLVEIGLVALTIALLRPRLSIRALAKPFTLVASAFSLVGGFAILKIARLTGISVPMNVNDVETVIFLVAVAPILEELIFRFMLFQPIQRVWNAKIAMVATSLLFSYSHLHAIWFVPPEYDKFLIYQTAYALPLGFACAYVMRRQRSLLSSMLVHATFNLGFFLAFWL